MINKKFLLSVATLGLLALSPSQFSFAKDMAEYESGDTFYIKGFYNGSKVHATQEFKDAKVGDATGAEYKPEYKLGYLGGGAALGYYFSGMRVEIEGVATGKIEPEDGKGAFFNEVALTTTGFNHMSGFVTGYYDFAINDMITPYIGAGAGTSYSTVYVTGGTETPAKTEASAWHIALQGKAGTSITVSETFVPYVGYKFHWMMDREYDYNVKEAASNPKSDAKKLNVGHMIHNIEAGVMIPINA